ncbi:tetraacyldisaccharide 4'-kinase [Gramella sp. KN1008]|uniref:tetraacyldisaccharide 4'-kinase n=1 Tax=Gramella sp. KN1008 TaxID=2529298 RepID=UPI00103D568C|nr:tetraacyldisaccharide 4'-kinase [Gramella sp. KN1008]TBW27554.1 tetraacyldisaccharide 4'-kinase [Gramella sp. KN1008]
MPKLRKLLFPFSVLYHVITGIRNQLYDNNILKSSSYDLPVIGVGNLNMGGTGKSPMIEYLLKLLSSEYKLATLSRGYKRESAGFQLVESDVAASRVGDEPLQFKNKFPEAIVAVDANRKKGIAELQIFTPDVILLDDAFQHRQVKAGFYILLTGYGDLYVDDLLLPGGNLRESSTGAERADVIVVTKCPADLSHEEMDRIRGKIRPNPQQGLYFSYIKYSDTIISKTDERPLKDVSASEFFLVTGIANPKHFLEFLASKDIRLDHLRFPDHHSFSAKEIKELKNNPKKILTTEKDYMRLKDRLPEKQIYYLPIKTKFLNNGETGFNKMIFDFINKK